MSVFELLFFLLHVAVMVFAFVLCWLPFHVGRYLFTASPESFASPLWSLVSQYCSLVSFVLFYLSAAINPILYNAMSKKYRSATLRLFSHSSLSYTESSISCWHQTHCKRKLVKCQEMIGQSEMVVDYCITAPRFSPETQICMFLDLLWVFWFPPSIWIGYAELPRCKYVCVWFHEINWHPIPDVFPPHSQFSWNRFWIHCHSKQDKVIKDEWNFLQTLPLILPNIILYTKCLKTSV